MPPNTGSHSAEYFRGCHFGYAAAVKMRDKHGRAFVEDGARALAANLRKRSETHTEFDRGYCHAYVAVAEAARPTRPDPAWVGMSSHLGQTATEGK